MVLSDAFPISWRSIVRGIEPVGEETSSATEKEFLIDFHEFFRPEFVLV